MKHDYTSLDAAILARIADIQPANFTRISFFGDVNAQAFALEKAERGDRPPSRYDKPAWRFVDSRLQALRKAGRITYQRKPEGWVLADKD